MGRILIIAVAVVMGALTVWFLVPAAPFAKVAEFQRRGVVHFHALIRVDGPSRLASAEDPFPVQTTLCRRPPRSATTAP